MGETTGADVLAAECRIFTRYLVGLDATPDVVAAYQRAHQVSDVEPAVAPTSLDRALLRVARSGPRRARAADAFAAVCAKGSRLRRKLVLLVAILESRAATAAILDSTQPGSRAVWMFELGARAIGGAGRLFCASLLIGPLCLWYRLAGGDRP